MRAKVKLHRQLGAIIFLEAENVTEAKQLDRVLAIETKVAARNPGGLKDPNVRIVYGPLSKKTGRIGYVKRNGVVWCYR